jgi:hypothetical protein
MGRHVLFAMGLEDVRDAEDAAPHHRPATSIEPRRAFEAARRSLLL